MERARGVFMKPGAVAGMCSAELIGKEDVDRLGEQLFSRVAEEPFHLTIDQHDLAFGVHQQQPAGGRVDDGSKERG
jgi:hypothetical protein